MADLIDRDVNSLGIETRYHKEGGNLIIERVQDVEAILEANKAAQNANTFAARKFSRTGFHKVASIPLVVIEAWMKEGINPFDKNDPGLKRKLNDRDFSLLKTTTAKL